MRRMTCLIAAFCSLAATASALTEINIYPSAAVGFRWLNVPASARVAALAGAYAARGAEPGALEANPAALAGMRGLQALFMHNAWIEGMHTERVVGAWHSGCLGAFAVSADYLDLGVLDHLKLNGAGQPVSVGTIHPNAMALAGSWGGSFGPMGLGLTLRGLQEDFGGTTVMGFQSDLGLRWQIDPNWRIGGAVKSVPLVSSNTLAPTSLRAGFGYTFDGSRPLAIDINTDYQLNDVEPPNVRASAEWAASRDLIFRAGYTAGNDRAPVGPSAGIGWMLGFVEFDYALYATGSLGISHLMTLRLTSVGSSRTAPMVVRGDPAAAWDCPPSAPPVEEKPMSMEAGLAAILALGFDAVWETPNVLLITLGDEKTHFDIDQDTIKEEGRQRLTALARILNEYDFPGATIRVDGHTDNTASRAWNLDLSLRRSQRVVNLMIDNGVKPETFSEVKAWGFDKPVAPNDTAEGRAKNRRVELRVRVIAKVVPIK